MAEKELRKLNRRELLELLLIQCEEMDRLQQEYSEMKTNLETFMESYERLKGKLNVKDERLNQKDAKIAELTGIIEELQNPKTLEPPNDETKVHLNKIFEDAQRSADQYLKNLNSLNNIPFDSGLKSKDRRRQSLIPLGRRHSSYADAPEDTKRREDAMHG